MSLFYEINFYHLWLVKNIFRFTYPSLSSLEEGITFDDRGINILSAADVLVTNSKLLDFILFTSWSLIKEFDKKGLWVKFYFSTLKIYSAIDALFIYKIIKLIINCKQEIYNACFVYKIIKLFNWKKQFIHRLMNFPFAKLKIKRKIMEININCKIIIMAIIIN